MLATWILLSPLAAGNLTAFSAPLKFPDGETTVAQSAEAPSDVVWIHGERVIIQPGVELENAAVLVEQGVIVAVGTDVMAPEGARKVAGKVVCAGFVDPWSSLQVERATVEDANLGPAARTVDGIDPYARPDLTDAALAGGVTSARIQAGQTAAIGGIGAVIQMGPDTTTGVASVLLDDACLAASIGITNRGQVTDIFDRVKQIERLVGQIEKGAGYRKSMAEYEAKLAEWNKEIAEKSKELDDDFKKAKKKRDKAVADAEEKGKDHKEKKYKEDKKPKKPRYDESVVVLGRVADGELPLVVEAHRVPDIRVLLRESEKLPRLRLVLAGATQAEFMTEPLVERRIPVLLWPAPEAAERHEYKDFDLGLAGRLAKAGVEVLIGSGGGKHARDLRYLAALAVGHGLDREAALHAITLGPARAFDVADRVGSLQRGRQADLLVFDGDPLDTTSNLNYVIARGRVVE